MSDEIERRYLPFDVDVEQALIGAILRSENDFLKLQESSSLCANDFYDPLHRRLYDKLVTGFSRGEMATPLTLAAAMGDDKGLAEVNGRLYLESLARGAPAMPNVMDYAAILRGLAIRRRLMVIGEDLANAACSTGEIDNPVDLADEAAEAIFDAAHGGSTRNAPEPIMDVANRALVSAETSMNNPRRARIRTGMPCVDTALGGIFHKELTVLAGAPSMGKSALAGQFALAAARESHGVMMFSKEMTSEEFVLRYMAEIAGVPAHRIAEGRISGPEFNKLADARMKLNGINYLIDESSHLTVSQMRARALAAKRRLDIELVIVDHLRFVQAADRRAEERDQIQQITRDLKAMAKELEIGLVLISHLNRDFWKRSSHRPMVSDLYGASAIEQNADHIWFIHREEYYLPNDEPDKNRQKEHDEWEAKCLREKGVAELFSAKRRGGPTGKARLKFNASLVRFSDPGVDESQLTNADLLALTQR